MSLPEMMLYFFIAVAALAPILIIITRNLLYGALALMVGLLALAGIYGLLQAEFIAITQIMVYAVGILILILFGIMLTNRISGKPLLAESHNTIGGLAVALPLFLLLVFSFLKTNLNNTPSVTTPIQQIGQSLLTTHVVAFEISGVLLLTCLVGASLIASNINKPSA